MSKEFGRWLWTSAKALPALYGSNMLPSMHDLFFETILASVCLPEMFQAVDVDNGALCDGGFIGTGRFGP